MQFIKESLWTSWTHILKNRHDLYFDLYGTKKPLVFVLIFAHGDILLQTQNTLYSLNSRRYRVFSFGADDGSRTRLCSLGSCRSTDELHPHLVHIITNAYFLCNTKNVAPSPVNFPKTAGFPALEMAVFHRHPQPTRPFVFPGCTVVPSSRNSSFFLL